MNKRPLCLTCVISLLLLAFFILTNCSTEEPGGGGGGNSEPPKDTTAPAEVEQLTSTTGNGSVTFYWQDPADADFKAVELTFTPEVSGIEQPLSVVKGEQAVQIFSLMNGTNYAFKLQTVDNAGNRSTGTEIMAAPDGDAPTAQITYSGGIYIKQTAIPFTVSFSEEIKGFEITDILTGNCTISSFSKVDSQTYRLEATALAEGPVTLQIAAGSVLDLSGNNNLASSVLKITYDKTLPTVMIAAATTAATMVKVVNITVTFSEEVIGFEQNDLLVSNATISNFATADNKLFTFDLTALAEGEVTVNIKAGVATDLAGNSSEVAQTVAYSYDITGPTPVLSSTVQSPTNLPQVPFTVTFLEVVKGFEAADIIVTGGQAHGVTTTDSKTFTFEVTPAAANVSLNIKEKTLTDLAGNLNLKSNSFNFTFDSDKPTVSLTTTEQSPTNKGELTALVKFSEAVTGFTLEDITPVNCTIKSFTRTNGLEYSLLVTPLADGPVELSISAGSALDSSGNGNLISNKLTILYDTTAPAAPKVNGELKTENNNPTWSWDVPADVDAFAYRLDGGQWQETADTATVTFSPAAGLMVGSHKLEVKAKDTAGNWSLPGEFVTEVYIETPVIEYFSNYGTLMNSISFRGNTTIYVKHLVERKVGETGVYERLYASDYIYSYDNPSYTNKYEDKRIAANTTYYYRVKFFTQFGESAYSDERSITTSTKPEQPSNFTFLGYVDERVTSSHISFASPEFSWQDNSLNEDGFELFVKGPKNSSFNSHIEIEANKSSGIDRYYQQKIQGDGWYEYYIRSYRSYGYNIKDYSANSNIVKVYLVTELRGFCNSLQVEPIEEQGLKLSWNQYTSGATGFHIERKEEGGEYKIVAIAPPEFSSGITSYIDTTAVPGVNYYYRVRAFKESKEHNIVVYQQYYSEEVSGILPVIVDFNPVTGDFIHDGTMSSAGLNIIYKILPGQLSSGLRVSLQGRTNSGTQYSARVSGWVYFDNLKINPFMSFGEGDSIIIEDRYYPISSPFYIKIRGANPGGEGTYRLKLTYPPKIQVKPFPGETYSNSYYYNQVEQGKEVLANFAIYNYGKVSGIVKDIRVLNDVEGNFQLVVDPAMIKTIPANETMGLSQFKVKFAPKSPGSKSAVLEVTSDDPITPSYKINLTGTGNVPSSVLAFYDGVTLIDGVCYLGNTGLDGFYRKTITVKNIGDKPLRLSDRVAFSNSGELSFDTLYTSSIIAAGGQTSFDVIFNPKNVGGDRNLTLVVESTSPFNSQFTLGLYANVLVPELFVKDSAGKEVIHNSSYHLGKLMTYMDSLTREFTIENRGKSALTVTSIDMSDIKNFKISLMRDVVIQPGMSKNFTIWVKGEDMPKITNKVTIITNSPQNGGKHQFTLNADTFSALSIGLGRWYESVLTSHMDSKYFYFRGIKGKSYSITWDERAFGSGKYTGIIKLTGYNQYHMAIFGYNDGGYHYPEKYTATEDGNVILKVEAESSFNSSHAGTFAIKVTELP